jgi:hypothetical protein
MIILITYSVSSCGPSTNDALNYFDKIISFQEAVILKEEALQNAVSELIEDDSVYTHSELSDDETVLLDKVDSAHKELLDVIDSSLQALKDVESFNNSTLLRDAARTMLATYREVGLNEYVNIIKLLRKPEHTFTESDNKYFNELWVKTINLKLNKAIDDFTQSQLDYAKSWNFDMEENGLQVNE